MRPTMPPVQVVLARQIACEEKMIIEALGTGKAEWKPLPPPANDEGARLGSMLL